MGLFGSKPKANIALLDREPPRPALASAPLAAVKETDAEQRQFMDEYTKLASRIGVTAPDNAIEAFKDFLRRKDLPVFALAEVVAYMDKRAAEESNQKSGWQWHPLREKDNRRDLQFGKAARWLNDGAIDPASDHYAGPHEAIVGWIGQARRMQEVGASAQPYSHTVPLHALRKIAMIESDFKGDVAFFVTDYALAPAIQYPDPFLMAVIVSPKARIGEGRFVIDFWDEPGFGIDKMIK